MKKKKASDPVADINVTPMVDVMLVMLIIFMVITPMLSKGISVEMAKTKNPIAMQAADKEDAVLVAITRDGRTYLGTDQMTPDTLPRQGQGSADQQAGQDGLSQVRRPRALRARGRSGGQPSRGGSRPTRTAHGRDPEKARRSSRRHHAGRRDSRTGVKVEL